MRWERLPDLRTKSPQQRNVVLHPEFVDGKYAHYTRPQDEFIHAGKGGGIGWGLCTTMAGAIVENEIIIDSREYHTIKEVKNGLGPAPIKTGKGWLHLAHGVRNTAAGLRYVLYTCLSELKRPYVITHQPGGYLLGPQGEERVGDVPNVAFSNGWISTKNADVFIYYGASDTRLNVVTSTVEKLLDYTMNTPADPLRSFACVETRNALIRRNLAVLKAYGKVPPYGRLPGAFGKQVIHHKGHSERRGTPKTRTERIEASICVGGPPQRAVPARANCKHWLGSNLSINCMGARAGQGWRQSA